MTNSASSSGSPRTPAGWRLHHQVLHPQEQLCPGRRRVEQGEVLGLESRSTAGPRPGISMARWRWWRRWASPRGQALGNRYIQVNIGVRARVESGLPASATGWRSRFTTGRMRSSSSVLAAVGNGNHHIPFLMIIPIAVDPLMAEKRRPAYRWRPWWKRSSGQSAPTCPCPHHHPSWLPDQPHRLLKGAVERSVRRPRPGPRRRLPRARRGFPWSVSDRRRWPQLLSSAGSPPVELGPSQWPRRILMHLHEDAVDAGGHRRERY